MFLCAAGAGCTALVALGWLGPSLIGALASPWTAQAWCALCAVVLLLALARAWRAVLAFSLPLVALSLWVLPVLLPIGAAAPVGTLKITYANVNAWNEPTPDAVQWFESTGADVVALIECSQEWIDALRAVTRAGSSLWPHAAVRIDDHPIAGVAVLSRHPLREVEAIISPEGRFPMIDAVVQAPGGPVRIMVAHPVPPVGVGAVGMRNAEIRWLAQRAAGSALPTAVVADFNDTPFGRALRDFAASSGMRSAASATGLVTTWPARLAGVPLPAPLRIAIDHCFVSGDIGIASLSAGPRIGSDHLPLVIDLMHSTREARTDGTQAGAARERDHGATTGHEASADQSPKLR
jgi:endonuclease/exonuclease/phosphatase (EEP) superfamily protein YafD